MSNFRRRLMIQSGGLSGNAATITFDTSMSDPANITGDINQKAIAEIVSLHRRCLCKKTAEGEVAICYLNDANSNQYHDGSTAKLDGTEGDVMVVRPEFWYKWAKVSETKFSETISVEKIEGGIHVEQCLIGAYKGYKTSNKLYSRSGVFPSKYISYDEGSVIAKNRGEGYSTIDFEQHCMIALILYAKYGTRNLVSFLGKGTAHDGNGGAGTITGTSNSTGITDSNTETEGYVCGLGIEGVFGALNELLDGISVTMESSGNLRWTISNVYSDGVRELVTPFKDEDWLSKAAIENGSNFDLIPLELNGSKSTYYASYINSESSNFKEKDFRVYRSGSNGPDDIDYFNNNAATIYLIEHRTEMANCSTRLAFRGKINVIDSVSEFKALPVL